MVELPWWTSREDEGRERSPDHGTDDDPVLTCEFQDGTLFVYEGRVVIERAGPSDFEDKTIPREQITDVTCSMGIAIGYLQIEQVGVENDAAGFVTSPVDENTLHFGRGVRDCAEAARDELLFGTE